MITVKLRQRDPINVGSASCGGVYVPDRLFLNIELRALPGLPFGDIGKFSLRLRIDNNVFNSIDPPTDSSFMAAWPSPNYSSRGEWHFLNPGGIGTGFSWAVTGIDDDRMEIGSADRGRINSSHRET